MKNVVQSLRSAVKRFRDYDPEMAYLNEATSQVDLECRQREIDRGRFMGQRRPGF
ncbi:DUF3563 domain-containing protein [Consotaella aegiceratis]|uniref:DUF3563 domain-containing protein n=1 Tax=Consotaella aegiceratis TaxID=3097961 RepID=UPI002F426F74